MICLSSHLMPKLVISDDKKKLINKALKTKNPNIAQLAKNLELKY